MRTLENALRRVGFVHVAGVDEVGRGCLAGPVVAAAVVLHPDRAIPGVCDSKLVPAIQRERLYERILKLALAWSVAAADPTEIDRINIHQASLRAMHRRCVEALDPFDGFHRFIPVLLHQTGHRVIEVPVNHRPRRFGRSHYGVRNRAWRGLVDLLGVRWMQSRRLRYEVMDDPP